MLSCKDITEHASEHLDGKTTLYQRLQFKLHLMICLNCRRFMSQFEKTVSSLKGMQPPPVEAEKIDDQVAKLIEETKKSNHP